MITRYEDRDISRIWSDQSKFSIFLDVELAHLKTLEECHVVPSGISENIRENVSINQLRIEEIEQSVRHDVVAFTSHIEEQVEKNVSKYFHFGLTSSDVIDTSLSIQIKESLNIILENFNKLLNQLESRAKLDRDVLCMGRSHGIFAEPLVLGQKWLYAYSQLKKIRDEYQRVQKEYLYAQFSGPVGNFTLITPEMEEKSATRLGLRHAPISTQVISRSNIAAVVNVGVLFASELERLAVELRHLQRTEVSEVMEGFSKDQKGSSVMPHKKNPISAENLTGISRVIRSHFLQASENVVLWHERDISHSSSERLYLPDHFGLISYSLKRMTSLFQGLHVNKEKCEDRVKSFDAYLSSNYLHQLIQKFDVSRDDAYRLVQRAAFLTESNMSSLHEELSIELESKNLKGTIEKIDFEILKKRYQSTFDQLWKRVIDNKGE